jgi:hypothetical protein
VGEIIQKLDKLKDHLELYQEKVRSAVVDGRDTGTTASGRSDIVSES